MTRTTTTTMKITTAITTATTTAATSRTTKYWEATAAATLKFVVSVETAALARQKGPLALFSQLVAEGHPFALCVDITTNNKQQTTWT